MKVFELLREESTIDGDIFDAMKDKGYTYLAKGVDQATFKDSKNNIIKIFGYGKSVKGSLSKHQLMFKTWAEYCEQHQGNKFLPQHIQWETFTFNNNTYLQIKMERLFPISKTFNEESIDELFVVFETSSTDKIIEDIESIVNRDVKDIGAFVSAYFEDKSDIKKFSETVLDIKRIGMSNGWRIDLHSENVMQDNEGNLVIVDPWHVGWITRW